MPGGEGRYGFGGRGRKLLWRRGYCGGCRGRGGGRESSSHSGYALREAYWDNIPVRRGGGRGGRRYAIAGGHGRWCGPGKGIRAKFPSRNADL